MHHCKRPSIHAPVDLELFFFGVRRLVINRTVFRDYPNADPFMLHI